MLKILVDDHPILRKTAEPVATVTPDLRTFAAKLMATMVLNRGLGLAAPQVGRSIRLIVFDCIKYTFKPNDNGFMFNPEIIESSEETEVGPEGCLSYPKLTCQVRRNKTIKVKYLDLSNKEVVRSYTGLAARVVQHEIDHLNGVVMKMREDGTT